MNQTDPKQYAKDSFELAKLLCIFVIEAKELTIQQLKYQIRFCPCIEGFQSEELEMLKNALYEIENADEYKF